LEYPRCGYGLQCLRRSGKGFEEFKRSVGEVDEFGKMEDDDFRR
jgi:hypothetical protein